LKRIDVAARQLELVLTYLESEDEQASEPTLSDADLSPAAISLKIIQAQEGERQHLAEEVHDGPAQVLTNAIFQVEYLDRVIDDNGRGFDVMRLASANRNFGLQFMRERAELMGSSLQIESRQGEGTRILLRIPEVH